MTSPVLDMSEVAPGVIKLTMQDRQHKNMFSDALITALIDAFANLKARTDCRVAILTGYDTYFSSGGTLAALRSMQEGRGTFVDTNLYSLALECEIPVIAAMQGHGIGGGLVLGLFADFVVLSRESVYAANFMSYGFTPGMGATYILPHRLGFNVAQEMLVTARGFRGEELAARGVTLPVLPRAEVMPYALAMAEEIADKPRIALTTLKAHLVRAVREGVGAVIKDELDMHAITSHQPEVRARIQQRFGR
jgi:polyketide biosynthesis enoyl-CoA hydratase PksI